MSSWAELFEGPRADQGPLNLPEIQDKDEESCCHDFEFGAFQIQFYVELTLDLKLTSFVCFLCTYVAHTYKQTNKQPHSLRVSLLGNWVPSTSWGPTLPLLLRSSSAPLSRGNELLSGGRAHNGTSHNATFTGPHTGPEEQSANQTLSGPSPRGQSSIVVQEEDRGNNNQSPWLSDFSSCLLLLCSIQSGLNASTSSLGTPMRELREQGDQKERSGDAKQREKEGDKIKNGAIEIQILTWSNYSVSAL